MTLTACKSEEGVHSWRKSSVRWEPTAKGLRRVLTLYCPHCRKTKEWRSHLEMVH